MRKIGIGLFSVLACTVINADTFSISDQSLIGAKDSPFPGDGEEAIFPETEIETGYDGWENPQVGNHSEKKYPEVDDDSQSDDFER